MEDFHIHVRGAVCCDEFAGHVETLVRSAHRVGKIVGVEVCLCELVEHRRA